MSKRPYCHKRRDRAKPAANGRPRPHEIEPGRGVPSHWEPWLVETWAERKARRAQEKAAAIATVDTTDA